MDFQRIRTTAVEAPFHRKWSEPRTEAIFVLVGAARIVLDRFKIYLSHSSVHEDVFQAEDVAFPLEMGISFDKESITIHRQR